MTPTDSSKYRHPFLPLDGGRFLTDGGLETSLIFQEGWDLPAMAAYVLMETEPGRDAVRDYFDRYVPMAVARKVGFILESPTWRANPDWGVKIGYKLEKLAQINRDSIDLMREIRTKFEGPHTPILISGCIGPRGDGYDPGELMSPEEAQAYHAWQIGVFADTGCDCVTAMTITNINEAIGLARAAEAAEMPCVISFTVETDGRLPTGHTLAEAIETVDAETGSAPAYYMINCAHPTHFAPTLEAGTDWAGRVRGVRANASQCSHAELDNSTELDSGNPKELGEEYAELLERLPHLTVLGGCCGTDHRHIEAISRACYGRDQKAA